MALPLISRYKMQLSNAVDDAIDAAKGKGGKFYDIFKSHGFYDVADPENKLTPEQRAQVPEENQHRFTDLSNALADMFEFILKDRDVGVLDPKLQEMIDYIDVANQMNKAGITGLSGLVPAGPAAAEGASNAMGAALGANPFDPRLFPSLAIGLDGISVTFANMYREGTVEPDWSWIYERVNDEDKKGKFHSRGDDSIYLGCIHINFDVPQGQESQREMFLKSVFGVSSLDENGDMHGDPANGVDEETYKLIEEASKSKWSEISNKEKFKNVSLSGNQIKYTFIRYARIRLWNILKNASSWPCGHWGVLTHNALPEAVRTSVSSYIWDVGVALKEDNPYSAFVSYFITIGTYYLTGFNHKVTMYAIGGFDQYKDGNGNVVSVTEDGKISPARGLPKDSNRAKIYFTLAADVIARTPAESTSARKRRIDEANKIYAYALGDGSAKLTYGSTNIPTELDTEAMKKRHFDKFTNGVTEILRYPNEGEYKVGLDGSAVSITYASTIMKVNGKSQRLEPLAEKLVRNLCASAGISKICITSLCRPIEYQVKTAMFGNCNSGTPVTYRKGAGQVVQDAYYKEKARLGKYGFTNVSQLETRGGAPCLWQTTSEYNGVKWMPVTGSDVEVVKNAMWKAYLSLGYTEEEGGENISKHSGNPARVQAIDISAQSGRNGYFKQGSVSCLEPAENCAAFDQVLAKAKKDGILRNYLKPPTDPCIHIEVDLTSEAVQDYVASVTEPVKQPYVPYKMTSTMNKENAWNTIFDKDKVDSANNT